MNASGATKDGCFYVVVSNVDDEDNGKLYVKDNGQMKFIVDMSGMRGFTGKTPQISIGSVSAGNGIYSAGASLSPNGTDADGNPAFLLSLTLPRLTYNNLTESQIAELQKPATDAAAELRNMAANGAFNGRDGVVPEEELEKIAELDKSAVKLKVVSTTSDQVFKWAEPFELQYADVKGVEFRHLYGEYETILRLDHFTNESIGTDLVSKDLYSVIEFGLQTGNGYLRGWVDVKNGKLFAKNQRDEVDSLLGYNYEQFAAKIEKLFGGGMTREEREKLTALDLKVGEIKKDVDILMVGRTIDEILGEECTEEDIENKLNEILS